MRSRENPWLTVAASCALVRRSKLRSVVDYVTATFAVLKTWKAASIGRRNYLAFSKVRKPRPTVEQH